MKNKIFATLKVLLATGYYLLVTFPLVVSAAQVTLQWDPNTPDPDGYNLYLRVEGESYDYDQPVNEDLILDSTTTVVDLEEGVRYFFVVTAVVGDEESGDSNEVEFLALAGSDSSGSSGSVSTISGNSSDNAGSGCFIATASTHPAESRHLPIILLTASFLSLLGICTVFRLAGSQSK